MIRVWIQDKNYKTVDCTRNWEEKLMNFLMWVTGWEVAGKRTIYCGRFEKGFIVRTVFRKK